MHPKLAHLSHEQVEDLMARYYARSEPVASLIREFQIDVRPSALVGTFPPITHADKNCSFCNSVKLVSPRHSRDHSSYRATLPSCPVCGHRESNNCSCSNCTKRRDMAREAALQSKRQIIARDYGARSNIQFTADSFSLRDALYLLAIARHSLNEDLSVANPFFRGQAGLAPTFELSNELVKHLYGKGLLAIGTNSPLDAFVFDEGMTRSIGYYPTQVIWEFLPGWEAPEKSELLGNLSRLAAEGPWPEGWSEDVFHVGHHIGKYECFEYYSHLLDQRGYGLDKFGEKTHMVFEELLKDFSIAQTMNLTWQTVRDVTDYIVREKLGKAHAKNTFIGALQRKADKTRAENWSVRCNRRDFNCPQSVVSSLYFDVFMNLGQRGFEQLLPSASNPDQEVA